MPTGYTAKIANGISFQEFAMDCARGMGACIDLRDEPEGGDKIPDAFPPSDYHLKAERAAQAELDGLIAMSAEDREKAALDDWGEANAHLLAASKKLYEALEQTLLELESHQRSAYCSLDGCFDETLEAARSALAAARGEDQ